MTTSSSISKNVMRRVRTIHTVRPLLSMTTLAGVLFLGAVWGIGREVWVAHIIENMPKATDLAAITRFFAYAFLNTRFVVQVLTVLAGVAFVYTLRDMVRTFALAHRFA